MHPNIAIGSCSISSYWAMLGIGSVRVVCFVWNRRRTCNLSGMQSILFALLSILGGFCAGKMMYLFLNPDKFGNSRLFSGGLTIYGPIFFDILIVPLVGYFFRIKPSKAWDLCAPCLAFLIGCQRIGCYLNGCCGGWSVCLPGIYFRWPAQMLESLGDFFIFTLHLKNEQNHRWTNRHYPMFLIHYSILRFFVEFLRDTNKNILFLSQFQWFSVIALLIGVFWNRAVKESKND